MKKTIPHPTAQKFRDISEKYFERWQYPNCVGAIDGKHFRIKCPNQSGSLYFNYKEFYSIVMLAIVDAEYKFIAIDVGSYGREGDAGKFRLRFSFCAYVLKQNGLFLILLLLLYFYTGIYQKSSFGKLIQNGQFNIPPPVELPLSNLKLPHVIIGDEAFALHENLMKSYPRPEALKNRSIAIYNYRHCRARRTTENSFGILCAFFRIFFNPIATNPDTTDKIITAACILHNILRDSKVLAPQQTNINDEMPLPTNNLIPIHGASGRPNLNGINVRNSFKEYFNNIGSVSWQNDFI